MSRVEVGDEENEEVTAEEEFSATTADAPADVLVTVPVTMTYDAQRRYQVVVGAPRGPISSRTFLRFAEMQSVVEDLVRPFAEVGPEARVQLHVSAPQPSWLSLQQPVLIRATADREAAPGWVGAFFGGGVWVMGVGGREDTLYGADELGDDSELTPEQQTEIEAAIQRAQDEVTVRVRLAYDADRRYRLSLDTPDGGLVTSEPLTRTAEAGPTAQRMVRAAYGDRPAIFYITSKVPPWLSEGQPVVILAQEATEFDGVMVDAREESFGWVGGFFDGGVYVYNVGDSSGGEIYAPEYLDDLRQLTADQLAQVEESKRRILKKAGEGQA
jgi:ribosomal protein L11